MIGKFSSLGSLEKKVMDCVWKGKKKTVRDVYECLKKEKDIAYTTVMTVMMRLNAKGFLTRRRKGRVYVYFPTGSRETAVKGIISRVFGSMVDQFGQEAVTAFSDELKKAEKRKR